MGLAKCNSKLLCLFVIQRFANLPHLHFYSYVDLYLLPTLTTVIFFFLWLSDTHLHQIKCSFLLIGRNIIYVFEIAADILKKQSSKMFELYWMKYFTYLLAYFRKTFNLSSIQSLCIMHPLLNQSRSACC